MICMAISTTLIACIILENVGYKNIENIKNTSKNKKYCFYNLYLYIATYFVLKIDIC